MQRIAERCGSNEQLAKELQSNMVKPITDKHNEIMANIERQECDEDAIRAEFADYGKPIPQPKQTTVYDNGWLPFPAEEEIF